MDGNSASLASTRLTSSGGLLPSSISRWTSLSAGGVIGIRRSDAATPCWTMRLREARPSSTGAASKPASLDSVTAAVRKTCPPATSSSSATIGRPTAGSRTRNRLVPGSLATRSNSSSSGVWTVPSSSTAGRARTVRGSGTWALLVSSQVTLT